MFLLISQKARKAKGLEKHGRCSKLVKQIFFLQYKNNELYDSREDLYSIHTLFALHVCIKHQNTDSQLNIKTKLLNYWFNFVFFSYVLAKF